MHFENKFIQITNLLALKMIMIDSKDKYQFMLNV